MSKTLPLCFPSSRSRCRETTTSRHSALRNPKVCNFQKYGEKSSLNNTQVHLLLKIVLNPTRSWNKSWLPVLHSYPKSRSPCHLWTRGLNVTENTQPSHLLAPILDHHKGLGALPLAPARSWAGLIFLHGFVPGVQAFRHCGSRSCHQTERHSTLNGQDPS